MLTHVKSLFAQRASNLLIFWLRNRLETIGGESYEVGPSGYRASFPACERNSPIRALPINGRIRIYSPILAFVNHFRCGIGLALRGYAYDYD